MNNTTATATAPMPADLGSVLNDRQAEAVALLLLGDLPDAPQEGGSIHRDALIVARDWCVIPQKARQQIADILTGAFHPDFRPKKAGKK